MDPRRALIKQTLHMLEEHNTQLVLKEQHSPSLLMHNNKAPSQCGFCRVFVVSPPPLQCLKHFLKITKVGKLHSWVSASNIYMFLQKLGREGGVLGCRYIYMQINIWELMEPLNAGKFGQSKRMHKDVDTKGENISFPGKMGERRAGKGGSCVIQQEKGSFVRSDGWHKEKSKIKQESIKALHSGGGFHSFPGHCAVQRASTEQRNFPSLIPSSSSFPFPSSLLPLSPTRCCPGPAGHRNQENPETETHRNQELTALPPLG